MFEEYSEKNHEELPPLTIIQGKGTILRDESDRNLIYDKAGLKNYKLVNKDDFILHLRSFEGGLEVANSKGIVSPAYHIFHGENVDTGFYYPFFRSKFFISVLLKPHVYGIRDGKSIDVDGMKTIKIPYPKIEEQQAIGNYFKSLDNLITLHQRSYIFVQGAKITHAWEQRKVDDITNRFDNLRVPVAATLRITGTTPYYGANGIQDYVEGFTHEGEFVLVAEDGANDLKNYPVNYVKGRIWVNNHAHVLQCKDSIADNRFLTYSLSQADIESVLVGCGRAKLNADSLMKLELYIPNLSEQQQIGTYFRNLDNLITLHQRNPYGLHLPQGLYPSAIAWS